jgi:hypothetical protein
MFFSGKMGNFRAEIGGLKAKHLKGLGGRESIGFCF